MQVEKKMAFEIVARSASQMSGDKDVTKRDAEHTGENLPPRNAAARLQARARGANMSPLDQFNQKLEKMIREFALRIMVPRWSEFDRVLESTDRICDRYERKKTA
jgi:hypothetical protein